MPVLLIDVSRRCDISDDLCIHMMSSGVTSVTTFMDKVKAVINQWDQFASGNLRAFKRSQEKQRLIFLIRDWKTNGREGYKNVDSHFQSDELFSAPPKSKSHEITCKYLMALVCHLFGNEQGVDEEDMSAFLSNRISHSINFKSEDEPVVENMVRVYVNEMRELIRDPETTQRSLVTAHNRLSASLVDQIKSIRCPVTVALNRIQQLNKRMKEEFERIRDGHKDMNSDRRKLLLVTLQHQYATALYAVIKNQKYVDDKELSRIHETERRKGIESYKSGSGSSDASELQERITHTFALIKSMNTLAREKAFTPLKTLISDQVKLFADQMRSRLSLILEIDQQVISNHFQTVKANALRSFDAALKNQELTPAMMRNMKRDFDSAVEKEKSTLR